MNGSFLPWKDATLHVSAHALHYGSGVFEGIRCYETPRGQAFTHDAGDFSLLGITHNAVLTIAKNLGYAVEVRSLTLEDLISADEAFFTGTATEVAAIREAEGRSIGDFLPGPLSKSIQDVFHRVTAGRDSKYSHWLQPVDP